MKSKLDISPNIIITNVIEAILIWIVIVAFVSTKIVSADSPSGTNLTVTVDKITASDLPLLTATTTITETNANGNESNAKPKSFLQRLTVQVSSAWNKFRCQFYTKAAIPVAKLLHINSDTIQESSLTDCGQVNILVQRQLTANDNSTQIEPSKADEGSDEITETAATTVTSISETDENENDAESRDNTAADESVDQATMTTMQMQMNTKMTSEQSSPVMNDNDDDDDDSVQSPPDTSISKSDQSFITSIGSENVTLSSRIVDDDAAANADANDYEDDDEDDVDDANADVIKNAKNTSENDENDASVSESGDTGEPQPSANSSVVMDTKK